METRSVIGIPFAQLLEEGRRRAGISQGKLAREVGLTRSAVSRLESGERAPSLGLAVSLASRLDLDLNQLKREGQ